MERQVTQIFVTILTQLLWLPLSSSLSKYQKPEFEKKNKFSKVISQEILENFQISQNFLKKY